LQWLQTVCLPSSAWWPPPDAHMKCPPSIDRPASSTTLSVSNFAHVHAVLTSCHPCRNDLTDLPLNACRISGAAASCCFVSCSTQRRVVAFAVRHCISVPPRHKGSMMCSTSTMHSSVPMICRMASMMARSTSSKAILMRSNPAHHASCKTFTCRDLHSSNS
jgi:hypothetical protein